MSLTDAAEAALLDLILLNVAWPNIGDASGLQPSAADGNFYISLHTADPGETGDQTTNEVAYTSYARVAIIRDGTGWQRTGSVGSNIALVQFPQCTGGSATATHFRIGSAASGAGNAFLTGALDSPLAISNGIQPQFAAGELEVTAS